MDLSAIDLNALLTYLLTALGAVLATRFPVVGPLLQRLLDAVMKRPAPVPGPAPAPLGPPAPPPGPSPLPVAPAVPPAAPAPRTGRPVLDAALALVWAVLQARMRGEALAPEEEAAVAQARDLLPPR